jgi:hypothetical protein
VAKVLPVLHLHCRSDWRRIYTHRMMGHPHKCLHNMPKVYRALHTYRDIQVPRIVKKKKAVAEMYKRRITANVGV